VTPDRNDPTQPDDENGVLADTGSIDTTGLGILGSTTSHLDVSVPVGSEDDLIDDDDVVGDEVDYAEVTIEDVVYSPDAIDEGSTEVHLETEIEDVRVDWITDENGTYAQVAEEVVVDDISKNTPRGAAPGDEPEFDDIVVGDGHDYTDADLVDDEVTTATGSIPATRREAHEHTHDISGRDTVERLDRAHAVERVHTRQDMTLTSKRFGEFEGGRESSDLLTADRLLDPHQVVRPEPEGAWQHFVYSITGHRINLGDGKRARARKELDRRIAAPLSGGARFVPVLSRKGGVGKTTITTLLGMALADARDDRIIAIDANPDRGTLAERIARPSGKTVRDLARVRGEVSGYNDISGIVARDETRLDVIASDSDPRISEAFSDLDYYDVASLAAHYYSIVLTDTGTGIVHSVMGATLELANVAVIVAGMSVDEARLASETLTWLETNGYAELARNAVVVINNARPGVPLVRLQELETHFRTRVRAVVRMPYDPLIAAGSDIAFKALNEETRLAARELAAAVVEGLRSLATAA
jgi:MinD-like ATPase involved in chromosome partitioning or flagellar assembly